LGAIRQSPVKPRCTAGCTVFPGRLIFSLSPANLKRERRLWLDASLGESWAISISSPLLFL